MTARSSSSPASFTKPFTPSPVNVLQAKLQAWTVNLISVIVDAYELGAVIGKGARIIAANDTLWPDVVFVPSSAKKIVRADAIQGAPALAVDILHSGVSEQERAKLRLRYAAAHVLEYWQIIADRAQPLFYQASAEWHYDLIPPDKAGVHFAAAMEELVFPAVWFRQQPSIWKMMEWWAMIS